MSITTLGSPDRPRRRADVYERNDGKWAFRIVEPDRRVVATDGGQGFATKEQAQAAVGELLGTADTDPVVAAWTDAEVRDQIRIGVEVFVHAWEQARSTVPFDAETVRIGDALALMAAELVKTERPPRKVLRSAFEWLSKKADGFADEFVRAAGKTTGTATGIGIGATATGHLPQLVGAIERVLRLLG